MAPTSEVLADMAELRSQLRARGDPHLVLLRLTPTRVLLDIALDWVIVFVAVGAVVWMNALVVPLAIVVIANRQRALGNILHDAGHRNLWRERRRNDAVSGTLVAPLLFASLRSYRESHFKHHIALGVAQCDPDFLVIPQNPPRHWLASYLRNVFNWSAWIGSFGGHLFAHQVSTRSKLYIVCWWMTLLGFMWAALGSGFTQSFVWLWLLSRATVFHLITVFREMCDHFGLAPGGVFTFTRDMVNHGPWRRIIHPRNNGYHLTHHLLPAVPYYRLPAAHALLSQLPVLQERAHACTAYFSGTDAVVQAWQRRAFH